MTKSRRREMRKQQQVQRAFKAVHAGVSKRKAAKIAALPVSTFCYQLKKYNTGGPTKPVFSKRNALTEREETLVVDLIKYYDARAIPLKRSDVADAVQIIVNNMTPERRNDIPFINGRPGRKFLRNFEWRHKNEIKIGKPSRHEAIRWKATNGENLTTHFAEIEHLIKRFNIDPTRMSNLDETGCTPNRDLDGKIRSKTYSTRGRVALARAPHFKSVHRVTMMSVIFASGEAGSPTFVVQGSSLPYRVIKSDNGVEVTESLADCIPRHGYVTTRKDVAGIDKFSFHRWAERFVKEVEDLTRGGRKVLLIYDGYRSHMGIRALETLRSGGVIAYALPAHTSGTLQPLDVGTFRAFKDNLKNIVSELSSSESGDMASYDTFDFLKMMKVAHEEAFTRANIKSCFREAGLCPLDPSTVLSLPRPLSTERCSTIASVEQLRTILEEKRQAKRNGLSIQPVVLKRGYVDTSRGLTLTSTEAMSLVRAQEHSEKVKWAQKGLKQAEKSERKNRDYAFTRAARLESEAKRLEYRVRVYKEAPVKPRAMGLRRAIARKRANERRIDFLRLHPERATPGQRLFVRVHDREASQAHVPDSVLE